MLWDVSYNKYNNRDYYDELDIVKDDEFDDYMYVDYADIINIYE